MPLRPLTLLLLAAPLLAGAHPRRETRREPLAMGAKLWITQVDGKVEVEGWDRPEVDLVADFEEAREGDQDRLEVRRVAEGLEIEVKHRQRIQFFHLGRRLGACHLTLKVPRKLSMVVHSVDGAITVKDLEGYAGCRTVDGTIGLQDIRGEVHAHSVDGNITGRHLKARVKGGSVDGNITLEQVEGGLDLKTVDGSITASDLDGWGEGIALRTVDGSIRVRLGQATGNLEAHTVDGDIRSGIPGGELEAGTRHRLKLRLPGRDQRIGLDTVDGSIQIDR